MKKKIIAMIIGFVLLSILVYLLEKYDGLRVGYFILYGMFCGVLLQKK